MQNVPKLTQIANSLKLSQKYWQHQISQAWESGHQAGLGFAIGDASDHPKLALAKEGFDLITEIDGIAIGTDWLTKIIAVKNCYGPWAVDVSETFLKKADTTSNRSSQKYPNLYYT